MRLKIDLVIVVLLFILIVTGIGVSIGGLVQDSNGEAVYECTNPVEETTVPTITTIPTEPETEPVIEFTEPPETIAPTEANLQTYLGEFRLTAYCSCEICCGYWATVRPLDDNGNPIVYTASGAMAKAGRTIAVDPTVIPYGTEVIINGNTYVAEDCGGAIKNKRIDVYFDDHQEALQFGVQYADVYLVGS